MTQAHPFDLSGRVAVVTGGNGGLGLGMARTMAELGCAISIWGRNADKNKVAKAELDALGVDVTTVGYDVMDAASVDAAFADTLKHYGRVDGMFANAGVSGVTKASIDRTPEEWRQMMGANLDGVVRCFQVAARHMIERKAAGDGFGRLVVTSSVASLMGAAYMEHYGTSKSAVNGLVRALAVELARHDITANAILPGYAESEMTAGVFANEKFVKNVLPRVPMRRFGKPEDYGGVAAYLMSGTSGYQTGQTFVIDGGYTLF